MIESKAINRKRQIIESARRLFKEKGYSATSMRDLSRSIGIEPASLYSHIKSKEEILKMICFDLMDKLYQSSELSVKHTGVAEDLFRLLQNHILTILENLNSAAVFMNDWKFMKEPDLSRFKSMKLNYEWKFIELIARGQKEECFKQFDPKTIVKVWFSASISIPYWYKSALHLDKVQLSKEVSEILLGGIKS